uniref:ATP synthase complex subunit 8 n=1 Tax=Galerucinae sp. 846596 TaxID=1213610 RepID=A0A0S2MSD1_9CUCU|nr:ATP synthase F0 subunit 8 [Galerucinae sp. 846596]
MPQMMPLNWLILFISFIWTFFLFTNWNYFNFNYQYKIKYTNIKNCNYIWKW